MSIIVSGRHVEVTESMKEYAESKLNAILEDKHKISSARIVLNLEKARHLAEVIVHGKGLNIEADSESYDMYESIDTVMGKIERQIDRYFDKKQDHHKTGHGATSVVVDDPDDNDFDYVEE